MEKISCSNELKFASQLFEVVGHCSRIQAKYEEVQERIYEADGINEYSKEDIQYFLDQLAIELEEISKIIQGDQK
jgi:hypothetical protein